MVRFRLTRLVISAAGRPCQGPRTVQGRARARAGGDRTRGHDRAVREGLGMMGIGQEACLPACLPALRPRLPICCCRLPVWLCRVLARAAVPPPESSDISNVRFGRPPMCHSRFRSPPPPPPPAISVRSEKEERTRKRTTNGRGRFSRYVTILSLSLSLSLRGCVKVNSISICKRNAQSGSSIVNVATVIEGNFRPCLSYRLAKNESNVIFSSAMTRQNL